MSYRIGVFMAATMVVAAGWAGVAQAQPRPEPLSTPNPIVTPTYPPTPTPSPPLTPSPTPSIVVCPPVLPLTASIDGVTQTSVTARYSMMLVGPPCGYVLPITMALFASQADAQQWRDPVARAVSGPERHGEITVDGLTPDTEYWIRFSDGDGRRDVYMVLGPARTLPASSCVAAAVVDADWSGGFVTTVTIRNTSTAPINGWRVSWQWPGDERIQLVWGGEAGSDGTSVTVRNVSYNGTVEPGRTAAFGLVVATSGPPVLVTPLCLA
jgi:cellulase/cellobiase CelA1